MLIELLSSKLYADGYTEESVNKIIDNIEINIINKNQLQNLHKEQTTVPKDLQPTGVVEYKPRRKTISTILVIYLMAKEIMEKVGCL